MQGWSDDPETNWKIAKTQLENEYRGLQCPKIPKVSIEKFAFNLKESGFSDNDLENYLEAGFEERKRKRFVCFICFLL